MPDQAGIVWFRANDSAPVLPFPSRVQSLDWSAHPWEARGIGEVYGAARSFTLQPPKPVPVRGRFCGTKEEFAGHAFKPSPPTNRPLDELGLPLCCGAPAVLQMGMILSLQLITTGPVTLPLVTACIGSPVLDLDTDYIWDFTGPAGQVYFARLLSVPGPLAIVITELVEDFAGDLRIDNAVGCGPPFGLFISPAAVGCHDFPFQIFPDWILTFQGLLTGAGRVKFRVKTGPC